MDLTEHTTRDPKEYEEGGEVWREMSVSLANTEPGFDAGKLESLRQLALAASRAPLSGSETEIPRKFIYAWLLFLLRDASDTFYLPHSRACDKVLYADGRPQSLRANWKDKLPWLRDDVNQLTILELELALVLFNWDEREPQFAWWVYEYPYILRRVHLALLRRYCWPLLKAFSAARGVRKVKAGKGEGHTFERDLRAHGYEAGRWLPFQPRIVGLVIIGLAGLKGLDSAQTAFFGGASGGWWILFLWGALLFLLTCACCGLVWLLADIDVFKQNHGLLVTHTHARRRTFGLVWRLLGFGVLLSFVAEFALLAFAAVTNAAVTSQPVLPAVPNGTVAWIGWLLGTVAQGVFAAFFGSLFQWLWEDRAATEPV